MDTYRTCVLCHSDTYYNCVKCHEIVCNRPNCSTSVDESHTGYSEDHPKAACIYKLCSGSKKRQATISDKILWETKKMCLKVSLSPYTML